jgi:hypothetical protein
MNHYRWRMLTAGDYALTTWVGESQLTYRITHGGTGWVLTRRVAGARGVLQWDPAPTLQESMAIAEDDAQQGL